MKTKKISHSTARSSSSPPAPVPTRDQIQALAHAIWTDRGQPEGCDVDIWLEAERQLHGVVEPLTDPDRVDVDTSDAAQRDRELERMVSPPARRSPTSL